MAFAVSKHLWNQNMYDVWQCKTPATFGVRDNHDSPIRPYYYLVLLFLVYRFFTFFLLEICHVISNHLISHLPCWGRANFPLQCCELPLLGKFCCALVSSEIMVGLRLQVRGSFFSLFICGLNLFHVNFKNSIIRGAKFNTFGWDFELDHDSATVDTVA